jgi:hypothetical protein
MNIEDGIKKLCSMLEMEVPPANSEGRYTIELDEGMIFSCFPFPGRSMIMEGEVLNATGGDMEIEEKCKSMLQLSLGRAKNDAGCMFYDKENQSIKYTRQFVTGSDSELDFIETAEEFMDELEFIRSQASGQRAGGASTGMFGGGAFSPFSMNR